MAKHRTYSMDFKRQVALEFFGGETLHGLAKRHGVSRNLILRVWVAKYEAGEFSDEAEAADLLQEYEARIAALERDEALWPTGFDRHGQVSLIPGCDEDDRQRESPRNQALAQQPGRKLTSAVQTARTGNGQIQGPEDPAEIRLCACLDPQPLQP